MDAAASREILGEKMRSGKSHTNGRTRTQTHGEGGEKGVPHADMEAGNKS